MSSTLKTTLEVTQIADESGYSSSHLVLYGHQSERFSMTLDFYKVILQDIVSDRSTSAILLDEAYCYAQAAQFTN